MLIPAGADADDDAGSVAKSNKVQRQRGQERTVSVRMRVSPAVVVSPLSK